VMISVWLGHTAEWVSPMELEAFKPRVFSAYDTLISGSGAGSEYTGWLKLPENYSREEFSRVKEAAGRIRSDSQALVVVGIGGSYLGARAAVEYLHSPFYNSLPKNTPDLYFAGNNLSAQYLAEIMTLIGDRDFSVNVISKSGTTTEPAVAFRFFKEQLEKKYGPDGARRRVYATTDARSGALFDLSRQEGYERFVIPDDVGGRYSVLTPVGLLPMAAAGIDIGAVMSGAQRAAKELSRRSMDNPALQYAAARNLLYEKGKSIEILASYEPSWRYMTEWWKQLFGESEGKDGRGIFPTGVDLTADLHSMGQYIQQGARSLFETVVTVTSPRGSLAVPSAPGSADGLDFLAGMDINEINEKAMRGTVLAHADGGVPVILIETPRISEDAFGELVYFFELSCGVSGYLLGINPFDQPGVESYKRNMFALLGKPGYEDLRAALAGRLEQNKNKV